MAIYNEYKWTAVRKDDGTREAYIFHGYGQSEAEALQHVDFWYGTGGKLSVDYRIIKTEVVNSISEYPFEAEDLLLKAFKSKKDSIASIMSSDMGSKDKESLIRVIENEDPVFFQMLDTVCRDWFIKALRQ